MPIQNKENLREKEPYKAELLAPAASLEVCKVAVFAGADAIYMGGQKYSARAFAKSSLSEEDELLEAIHFCHLYNKKIYMTLNTLFKEGERKELFSYMDPYYEAGLDGVIIQDLGIGKMLAKAYPDLPLHASTQMTVHTKEAVGLMENLGMERVVLSRECSLEDISDIAKSSPIELEVFIHGSMCYSYSGACFMSSLLGGRSGNRGRCAGTCRLCYSSKGKKGNYLSMKDMFTLDLLKELLEAGAYSLKIEGRMKSALYTGTVVSIYRKYLDLALQGCSYKVSEEDIALLKEVYDRGGYSSYLEQHNGEDMIAFGEKPFRKEKEEVLSKLKQEMEERERKIPLKGSLHLSYDEVPCFTLEGEDGLSISVEGSQPVEKAKEKVLSREQITKQMKKMGNTEFSLEELSIHGEEDIFYPLSFLNQLRRDGVEKMREAILGQYRRNQRLRGN